MCRSIFNLFDGFFQQPSFDFGSRPSLAAVANSLTASTHELLRMFCLILRSFFQTLEVLRLQTELEEYEYEDAMGSTANGAAGGGEDAQPASTGYW